MAKTLVALYDDENVARETERELSDKGIDKNHREMMTWREVSEGKKHEKSFKKLVNSLESRGVPSSDAREFAEAVRRGGNLLVTEVDDDSKADEIARLLDEREAVDLEHRKSHWKSTGYKGFQESAKPYSSEQVERERQELAAGEQARIQKTKEKLKVGKRGVSRGGIRVHKTVSERPVEEEIELREEDVDVERRKVDKPASESDAAFQDETIEVREHAEEPVVEKETRVDEEIVVGKKEHTHTETISETVRETDIDIEQLGGSSDRYGYSEAEPSYRQHYGTHLAAGGDEYARYEPAYRYGHTLGSEERYRDQSFSEVEPEFRSAYERKHGKGTYEKVRDAARYGFEQARSGRSKRKRT